MPSRPRPRRPAGRDELGRRAARRRRPAGAPAADDLARDLAEAGFERVTVTTRPDWYAIERALFEAALEADPGDDQALHSLQEEARRSLATFDLKRRVFATARAPAP